MKKTCLLSSLGLLALVVAVPASAQPSRETNHDRYDRNDHDDRNDRDVRGRRDEGRARGTITRNAPREVYWRHDPSGRYAHHPIVVERRAPRVIARDRYARQWHRGFRSRHDWHEFHPSAGWIGLWGIESFARVSTVTCEAASSQTGELYPVQAHRTGRWTNAQVDSVLDQALDECAQAAGEDVCVPAQPACSYR
ncbi:MAG: hypothetical protein ACM31C_20100 [Acidobacteriota bacterium]